jgi:hypothetical protein
MMKVIEVVEFYINNVHDTDYQENLANYDLFYEMYEEFSFDDMDEFYCELEIRDIDFWGNKDYIKDQDFWDEHQKLVDKLDEEYLNDLNKDKKD